VEDVFPGSARELMSLFGQEDTRGSVNGKAWVNQTLEQNPVPVIWISNSIRQIDPAYLRRFQFHLELKIPPPLVRENIIRKHLGGLAVSDAFIATLAARKTLTPAQVQSAARFVELARPDVEEPVEALILRQLEHADRAMGLQPEAEARPVVTHYRLDNLNLETRYAVNKIVQALGARKRGTLCFYGPPGTGKTALAEHIAAELDLPLMIRRASDLMSKYVGETEQQIAAMFARAEEDGRCCYWTRPTASCKAASKRCATTRCPKSTRCCRAWNASTASLSAPPICSIGSTKPRCGGSRSRFASRRSSRRNGSRCLSTKHSMAMRRT
jgi:hypothetical protein